MINILKKNKTIYDFIINKYIFISYIKVYFLQVLNFFRVASCTRDSIRCEYNVKNKHYKYTLLGKNTPTCCLTHLYEITRDITSLLNKEGVDYFIMYGTLLGQVRHNQTFIPWDTDVDIVVIDKDKEKVVRLLTKKLPTTYDLMEGEKILKVNFSKSNHLHADIYFWEEKAGVLIDTLNDYWVKNRVKKNDVFPLSISKLYDLDVKVPKNSIHVLKDTYGADCLKSAYKKYALKKEIIKVFNNGIISSKNFKMV